MLPSKLNHIIKTFSGIFPLDFYWRWTKKLQVLPFYHTVSDHPLPHFSELKYFRSKKRFLDDLDFFTSHFENISMAEVGKEKKSFHLSFDDGMAEMYSVVFPILQEKKLDATFFINTDFVDNKCMFISHKINLIQHELKKSSQNRQRISGYLECETGAIHSYLNRINSEKADEIAKLIHLDFTEYLKQHQPYLTTKQIITLKNAGFTIGNHGKSHKNFNTLTFEEQKNEIETVNSFLKQMGVDDLFFCFPYGDYKIKNELFHWMYQEGGIEKSFGISGLKEDGFPRHHHRILMEHENFSAEEIIRSEYLYFMLKSVLNKNKIRR